VKQLQAAVSNGYARGCHHGKGPKGYSIGSYATPYRMT
jgi:hypothetical protein